MFNLQNLSTLSGELFKRTSGGLVWSFSPSKEGSSADNILTAYHPDIQPEPIVEGKFKEMRKINLMPSEEHGYGALKINDFEGGH